MAKSSPLETTAPMTAAADPSRPTLETTGLAPPCVAELAALRERLREVEAALGLPLRPGQATPPDLPALRRRVAALERHLGLVPGLAPLPGCGETAAPRRATTITAEPAGRRPAWREWGRAVLVVAALVALLAWLLHPLPGGPGYFRPAAAPTPAAAPAPAEEVPVRADYRAQHEGLSPAPGAPRTTGACRPGDSACLPDDDLPATPRERQRLGSLDTLDYGLADGDALPPQEDGHDNGPR